MFISFEGIDGTGKTTQIGTLRRALEAAGHDVVQTREPGGSPNAEAIRALVLSGAVDRWSAETEVLLFTAARRDHMENVIWPALEGGKIVLCDRFVDSTRAYQGQKGAHQRLLVDTLHARLIATLPDLTLLLDMPPEAALPRRQARDSGSGDRFEQAGIDFQHRLRGIFLELAAEEPTRIVQLDARLDVETLAGLVLDVVARRLLATDPASPIP